LRRRETDFTKALIYGLYGHPLPLRKGRVRVGF
jgi:hypothetical protein